jgi:hypothetical protein
LLLFQAVQEVHLLELVEAVAKPVVQVVHVELVQTATLLRMVGCVLVVAVLVDIQVQVVQEEQLVLQVVQTELPVAAAQAVAVAVIAHQIEQVLAQVILMPAAMVVEYRFMDQVVLVQQDKGQYQVDIMNLLVVVVDQAALLVVTAVLHMDFPLHFPLHHLLVFMAAVVLVAIILVAVVLVDCVFCGQEDLVLSHQQV